MEIAAARMVGQPHHERGDPRPLRALQPQDAVPVRIDVLGLRRAIANVLENAAKYSDDVIEVDTFETDEGAAVRVRDRGRGIHPGAPFPDQGFIAQSAG